MMGHQFGSQLWEELVSYSILEDFKGVSTPIPSDGIGILMDKTMVTILSELDTFLKFECRLMTVLL